MKIILSSSRFRHVARAIIFLVAVALVAGMVGCGCVPFTHRLIISSTEGGSVTTPGEGTFSYFVPQCCPSQELVAEADEGYRFVEWTWTGPVGGDSDSPITYIQIGGDASVTAHFGRESMPMVAAGGLHTIGLKDNGRVFALGDNSYGQCNVGDWRGITQVAAGYGHTVGIESDGTVIAVGDNDDGQCDVSSWTNIIQVAAGDGHTEGLKSDRTVVAVGANYYGQCNVGGWNNITQIATGDAHTVGIMSDGTVVAVGGNRDEQCNVGGSWMLIS